MLDHVVKANVNDLSDLKHRLFLSGFTIDPLLLGSLLENELKKGKSQFAIYTSYSAIRFEIELTLNFKWSIAEGKYYWHSYIARHAGFGDDTKDFAIKIDLRNGFQVSLHEVCNLFQGRYVLAASIDYQFNTYNAWIKVKAGRNSKYAKLQEFPASPHFKLKKMLRRLPILECRNKEAEDQLLLSLHEGNIEMVTFHDHRRRRQCLISADPEHKTIQIYKKAKHPP